MTERLQLEEAARGLLDATYKAGNEDPHHQLAELDYVIDTVEDLLGKLILQRAPLKSRINQLNSPIIQLLPAEVISCIFAFCLPDFHSCDAKFEVRRDVVTPFLLGSICQCWRHIAWTTPALWSSLHLHFSGQNFRSLTDLASQWLSRSGTLHLSIRISCEPKSSTKTALFVAAKDQLVTLIKIFNSYSLRWRNLDIRIPTSFFEYFGVDFGPFPLDSLHIDPPDGQSDNNHTLSLENSPQLTRLYFSSVYLKSIQVQWDNITHVFASAFYVDECLEIMRRSPRLICCKFPSVIGGEAPYPIEGLLNVPSLKYLHLGHERSVFAASFLDHLTLPSLEELIYDGSEKVLELQTFLQLLNRSSCSLLSLAFQNIQVDFEFLDLMEKLPSLRQLSIRIAYNADPVLTDAILDRLGTANVTKGDSGHILLPSLERLHYTGPQSFSWSHLLLSLMKCGEPLPSTSTSSSVQRRSLHAAKITLTAPSNEDVLDEKVISRFLEIMENEKYVDLQLLDLKDKDLLEQSIEQHLPGEKERYVALRNKMRDSHGQPFAESNHWII